MTFFKFAFKQKEKGFGRVILFSMLLALILTISIIVSIAKQVAFLSSKTFLDAYEEELACKIVNYELTCKEDYYEFEQVKIDLNYDSDEPEIGYNLILTKTMAITGTTVFNYKDFLVNFDETKSSFDIYDGINALNSIMPLVYIVVFFGCFIGMMIAYPIGNLLVALIIRMIINPQFKTNFNYSSIYKITLVTTIPYVLFNALTRMLFDFTISSYMPIFLLRAALDYLIIYGLTYLAIKEGLKEQPIISVEENSQVTY